MYNSVKTSLLVYLLLGLIFVAALIHAFFLYAPCDDAYIYLVYVKNFHEGNGLTFNGEKVQGFTSVLWVVMLTAFGFISASLPLIMENLSRASGLFVFLVLYYVGRQLTLTRLQALLPPILLACTGDFAFYMGTGLETVFFSGMVLLSFNSLFYDDPRSALRGPGLPFLFSLTVLSRPEGALVACFVLAWLTFKGKAFKDALMAALVMSLMVVPVYLLLRWYTGYWLPNTYYAKSGMGLANLGQGIKYTWHFLRYYAPIALLVSYVFIFKRDKIAGATLPLFVFFLLWFAQVTVQGGDNMVGFRMFLPVLPMMYLVIALGFKDIAKHKKVLGVTLVGAFMTLTYSFGTVIGSSWEIDVKTHAAAWRKSFEARKTIGIALRQKFPADTIVALNAAGVSPYYSGFRTIDMLGLNNKYIT